MSRARGNRADTCQPQVDVRLAGRKAPQPIEPKDDLLTERTAPPPTAVTFPSRLQTPSTVQPCCFGENSLKDVELWVRLLARRQKYFCFSYKSADCNYILAERAGFEPALGYYPKHAFQACDLNHSSISPEGREF